MWVYLLLLIVVFIMLLISSIYVVKVTKRILSKYILNKLMVRIISFFPILLFFIGIVIDMVNTIVVVIHLIAIVTIMKLLFWIINKFTKKETNELIVLGLGVIATIIVMVHAYYQAYNVVETHYDVYTNKELGMDNFRIVQVSDSHIGTTMDGNKFSHYMVEINKLVPDIVVITGDFIDDNTSSEDIESGAAGLGKLVTKEGVYFVFGNHDKGYYNKNQETKLREELKKNNVIILEDALIEINDKIVIIGRKDASDKERVSVADMTKDIDNNKYIILLDHQPNDYENEKKANIDLVLSGHTHGGQLIPLGFFGLLLGANDKVYGMEIRDNSTFIVNSGISDWAIKFKTGTKSEYGVIDIKNKNVNQ